jgi:uncharacterized protein YjeT (DUF2065 family)
MKRTYTFDLASDLTRSLKFPGVLLILEGMVSIRYKKEAKSILKPICCIRERDLRLMGGECDGLDCRRARTPRGSSGDVVVVAVASVVGEVTSEAI